MWLLTATLGNFFLMLLQAGEASKAPITDQQRLVNTIFENYDKALRPVENTMTATNVTLNPGLFSIVDTDEASESIVIAQTFRMMWKDFFLSWNPNEYEGMKQLLIPLSLIWHPDIFVINLIEIEITLPEEKNYASINYDGSVLVTVPEIVTFHCKYHINMFPFDVQNCTMRFTSWMYTAEQMDLFHLTQTDLDMYTNSTEWDFISFLPRKEKVFHGVTENSWVYINYDLIIQRKPTYYLLTFVLPCVIITTISIIGIFAPFNDSGDREEKVTMGLTTMLTMAVIFTVITDQMPKTSEGMPLLGIYILLQIALSAGNAFLAVFIMYQQRRWTKGDPVPGWIMALTSVSSKKVHAAAEESKSTTSVHYLKANDPAIDINAHLSEHMKQQLMVMNEMRGMMRQITEHKYDQEKEHRLRKEWQSAAHRLDLILMLFFLILHFALTLAFLIIGSSNLQV